MLRLSREKACNERLIQMSERPRQRTNENSPPIHRWDQSRNLISKPALTGDRFSRPFHGLHSRCARIPSSELPGYWQSSADADSFRNIQPPRGSRGNKFYSRFTIHYSRLFAAAALGGRKPHSKVCPFFISTLRVEQDPPTLCPR